MTAYLVSTNPDLVFAAPDRTTDQLRGDVENWISEELLMTVAGVDAAGDEASTVIAWAEITDYSISDEKPDAGGIVMTATDD